MRTRIAWVAVFLAARWIAAAAADEATGLPSSLLERVESAIAATISAHRVPGLSVAVVTDGELRWSKGYGFADLENFVPFTATTVHRLASVSKTITAVAAMQLAESGKLELDAPIQRYCRAFPAGSVPITPRQLLGHLSGIRHYRKDENFNSTRHYEGVTASLDAFKDDPLVHEPGAAYTYSTYGYVVLGCVIEGASGVPYEEYVRERIARPAGMDRTRVDDQDAVIPYRARGYARRPSGEIGNCDLADTSNKIPGGGLVSTAEDLARFAIALETGRLLRPETFRRMQSPMKTTGGKDSPYFGWTIIDRNGEKILTHSGSQQGTATYFVMVPVRRFALALLANTEDVRLGDLAKRLTELLLP